MGVLDLAQSVAIMSWDVTMIHQAFARKNDMIFFCFPLPSLPSCKCSQPPKDTNTSSLGHRKSHGGKHVGRMHIMSPDLASIVCISYFIHMLKLKCGGPVSFLSYSDQHSQPCSTYYKF